MDPAEEIKKRLDIVEFIGQYLQLKKVGINYSALCPFHSEKVPSFMVSPERQSFRCFSCGESGDVISFFMKIEGLTFSEALRILGERTGVQVSFRPKEQLDREKSQKDEIYKINLIAAKYFKTMLWSKPGTAALEYLRKRGLSDKTIQKLKIGYAPPSDALIKYYANHKISGHDLDLAGHPERFRYRVIFPIFDTLGQVIGFSGRIFEPALPKGVSPHPKYLNTPETPVFHKSKALYGINFAKDAIRQNKRVVVVEGQMDVAASHEAGIEEVVATSGTALTSDHLKILSRYSAEIIFAFDEDEAGQKAAISAVQLALKMDLETKLTIIDGHKDVGELVAADKKKWPQIIDRALYPVEWLVAKATRNSNEMTVQVKKKLTQNALLFISSMQDEIEKAHYLSYLAKVVQVPEIAVEKALTKYKVQLPETPKVTPRERNIEGEFLSFLINFPTIVDGLTLDEEIKFKKSEFNQIYKRVISCYTSKGSIERCLVALKKNLPREIREELDALAIAWDVKVTGARDEAFQDFLAIKNKLETYKKEAIKDNFAKMIAEAEAKGDLEEVKRLMKQLQKSLNK